MGETRSKAHSRDGEGTRFNFKRKREVGENSLDGESAGAKTHEID